jgi:hypothetical protein
MSSEPAPHGSWGAYKRHKRRGEEPCDACAEAARRQWRERHPAETRTAGTNTSDEHDPHHLVDIRGWMW